jgi:hypothetical protein
MNSFNATTKTTVTFAWIVVALVATSAGGCMNAARLPQPRFHAAGDLALTVPVALRDATVEVTVTGSDMTEPVTARLQVQDGVAQGTVGGIAAGPNRLVLVTATDRQGRRCAREVNASVDALAVSSLDDLALECTAPAALAIAAATDRAQAFPPVL